MARVKAKNDSGSVRKIKPAISPEARENQMISLAVDSAEKQMLEGTASSQIIVHYLKLGTMKHKLELEKLEKENELMKAKTESLRSAERIEEMYLEALKAMSTYRGDDSEDD